MLSEFDLDLDTDVDVLKFPGGAYQALQRLHSLKLSWWRCAQMRANACKRVQMRVPPLEGAARAPARCPKALEAAARGLAQCPRVFEVVA